ncbi:MAG: iron-sulfur cluster assembly scaffold protein [Nanobdellota archaeon]
MYNDKIIKRFQNPVNAGEIENPDGVGKYGNPKCGDIMKISIKVKDGILEDIKFKTYGCVAAIASTDALCDLCKGKKIDEALNVSKDDVVKSMGGDVPSVKVHCSILAQNALKKAVDDYRNED